MIRTLTRLPLPDSDMVAARMVVISPADSVWVADRRPLVTVHLPHGAFGRTDCGFPMYAGEMPIGERITGREAIELVGQPCVVCFRRWPR